MIKFNKPSKKLLGVLGSLVGLVLILLIALPLVIDVNRYRGLIENTAHEALGREVRLGEMKLSLLPSVAVRIDDLAIGALPEEGGGDLLTARQLRVGAHLLPLLRKQLKVTSIVVDAPELALVRDSQGRWNMQRLLATRTSTPKEIAEPAASGYPEFEVGSLRITNGRLDLRDEVLGSTPLQATLTHVDVHLENVNPARSIDFELSGRFNGSGRFHAEGQIGPLAGESGGVPLKVALSLDPIPPSLLPLTTEKGFELDTRSGTASVSFDLSGNIPDLLRVQGTSHLSGFKAHIADPTGERQEHMLDVEAAYDLTVRRGGEELQIHKLVLDLLGSRLSVRGMIEREAQLQRVDVELLPTSITADRLTGLLGMVIGELPVSFASDAPIELQARVKGLVGEGRIPRMEGDAKLQGFSFMHASLDQPLTQVGANVALRGDSLQITGLTGVVGSSDFAGDMSVAGFQAPRITFNLHSKQADFGELFSFLNSEQEDQSTPGTSEETDHGQDALMTLEGKINIERGSFDTLKFKALEAQMKWADGILTMRPVTMQLYDGEFRGEVISDLSGNQPSFNIRGDAQGVDLDGFLGDNLDSSGLLYGRFLGSVETQTVGADYASIIGGLNGKGTVEVLKGRIAGLDILETLSKVSGVFGEDTLRSLSSRLAADGTAFNTMSGGVRFESGNMLFDGLLLDSPDFNLHGVGAIDLLNATLKGEFRLNLSRQLSASMRAERSRAGELFWNGSSQQVEVPFSLTGPFTEPSPSVDWNAVAETALRGRAEEEILKYLEEKFGGKTDDESQPPPEPEPEKELPQASGSAPPSADLSVEINKLDWGGSFLAPDLEIAGFVHGKQIDRAEVLVIDAQGTKLRHDRLGDVDQFVTSSSEPSKVVSIQWKYEVDGKHLLLATFPVTVRVIVYDTKGASSEKVNQVNR